jgi:mono/diheme cytochrome c family protein
MEFYLFKTELLLHLCRKIASIQTENYTTLMEIRKSVIRCLSLILVFMSICLPNYAQDGQTPPPAAGATNGLSADAAIIDKGKSIFTGNCAQCHAVHEQVVGPKLAGVYERQSIAWLTNFIKYPQKVIESGDAHAVELYKQYKQFMPNHDFLSDAEILSILSYIQDETKKGPAVATTAAATSTDGSATPSQTSSTDSSLLLIVILTLAVLLIVLLGVMVFLLSVLSKYVAQKEDLTEEDQEVLAQRFDFKKLVTSSGFIAIVGFLFVAFAAKATIDGIFAIGLQQGYAPDQPIKFSHKLHAGYYEIDCKYCHTGVEKGKQANIPAANICMNCHNAIKTTSPEIQKIYAAIENDAPIQWVRVHNLPDLSYFNHAQHVKVGGIECETCHGEIKEMELVQQHSMLTMGWCIDCHRKTEVKTEGNKYYDNLVEIHKTKSKEPLRVENIGGLECSKCHY